MRLAIDTAGMTFVAAGKAEKVEADGTVEYRLKVTAVRDGDAAILTVVVPDDPKVSAAQLLRLDGLEVSARTFAAAAVRPAIAEVQRQESA